MAETPSSPIDRAKFDRRLEAQIDHLRTAAQSMLTSGASEEAIAALFAMHDYVDDLATRNELDPGTPEHTAFLGELRDGIWGLYRGFLMGSNVDRDDQLKRLVSGSREALLNGFRSVLMQLNGGKRIGAMSSRGADEFKL